MSILVLTNTHDGKHSDVVLSKLRDLGDSVYRLNVDSFAAGNTKISFSTTASGGEFHIQSNGGMVSSGQVKSVWYRRPRQLHLALRDRQRTEYAENECLNFIEGLWWSLDTAFWVSNPMHLERARKKVVQLDAAIKAGLNVPRTIISNDPKKILDFCQEHLPVVYKATHGQVIHRSAETLVISTTVVTKQHLEHVHLIAKCPGVFQQAVKKQFEVRATFVGNRDFSVRIDAPHDGRADWRPRRADGEPERLSPVSLPNSVRAKCLNLLSTLGLVFGAFDFAVDEEGAYWFLEVNPNGQWYWIERATGLDISGAIASLLRNPSIVGVA